MEKWYLENIIGMAYKNKEDGRKRRQGYRDRNKKVIKDYLLNHPCEYCGFKDTRALCFDHIDRSKKTKNVCALMNGTTGVARLMEEVSKCRVLCANCHYIKTMEDQDYLNSSNKKRS